LHDGPLFDPGEGVSGKEDVVGLARSFFDNTLSLIAAQPLPVDRALKGNRVDHQCTNMIQ
jgi:hypothetical protein